MFNEYFKDAKINKLPISIFTDVDNTDKFSFGFVQEISDEHILINCISPFGFYDGYTIRNRANIYRIEYQNNYGKKLHKLYQIRNQKHQLITRKTDNLIADLIHFAKKENFIVSIELHNSDTDDLQGYISNVKDTIIAIEQIDEYGKNNGKSMILLEDITKISCDSDQEIMLKLLSER